MFLAEIIHGLRKNQKPLVCFLSSSLHSFVLFIKLKIIWFVPATIGCHGRHRVCPAQVGAAQFDHGQHYPDVTLLSAANPEVALMGC